MSCKFTSHADEVLDAIGSKMYEILEECGMDAEYYAKRKCPVDTGRLRNSITHEVNAGVFSGEMTVGTNVEYAGFVENGTYRQKAQPYIKPSISDHKEHYQDIMRKHLKSD